VTSIELNNERFTAKVKMAVEKNYKFPKDTTASILTSGLLGEQYIGLEGGGDDQLLKAGDSIRLTQSAVVLEKLISQFLFDKAAEGGDAKK
jgi:phospholipid/cholesterol/gamma-HCH transport system substrate-binding protein